MKLILKNTQIRIFNLGIVLMSVIALGVFMQGCSNEEDYYSYNNNQKLESLVASSEYMDLNESIKDFGVKLKSNYLKLSITEKEKVIDILNAISEKSNSQVELEELIKEFNSITEIDFKSTINEVDKNVVKLKQYNEVNNISNKEFSLAVNKYSNSNIPRLKNGTENMIMYACIAACSALTAVCITACTGPQALLGCHAGCMAVYAICCLTC